MRILTILLALVAFSGCDSLLGPDYQLEGGRPMDPPASYRKWYTEVTSCLGMGELDTDRMFDRIEWYSADRIYLPDVRSNKGAGGMWNEPNTIVIKNEYLNSERTVKHELIHYALQGGDHDAWYFAECAPFS